MFRKSFGLSVLTLTVIAVAGCGSDDDPAADPGPVPLTVPKVASCSAGDKPETALQGQVPAALRAAGYTGFNCNLRLVGQYQGEGGNWSSATFIDSAQRACAYYSTAARQRHAGPGREPGRAGDRHQRPRHSRCATSVAHHARDAGSVGVAARQPRAQVPDRRQRRRTAAAARRSTSTTCPAIAARRSCWQRGGRHRHRRRRRAPTPPDRPRRQHRTGRADLLHRRPPHRLYHAVDVTNPTKPKLIATFDMRNLGLTGSVSTACRSATTATAPTRTTRARFRGPAMRRSERAALEQRLRRSSTRRRCRRACRTRRSSASPPRCYKDGSVAQHTIPVNDRRQAVHGDGRRRRGRRGLADHANATAQAACAAGPRAVPDGAHLRHQRRAEPEGGLQADARDARSEELRAGGARHRRACRRSPTAVTTAASTTATTPTALACSYFNSGIRVFDIRDPERPKEIAYYNPPTATLGAGVEPPCSAKWRAGGPDWCASRLDFDFENKQLITMCQDNGLLVLQFGSRARGRSRRARHRSPTTEHKRRSGRASSDDLHRRHCDVVRIDAVRQRTGKGRCRERPLRGRRICQRAAGAALEGAAAAVTGTRLSP